MTIDMKVNTSKYQSISSSFNSSRTLSVHSVISFTVYTECIQALANNLTQTNQVKISKSKEPTLSYMIPKVEETNIAKKAITSEPSLVSYNSNSINIYKLQLLESSAILYTVNQSVDL